jgi:hypothetical protein
LSNALRSAGGPLIEETHGAVVLEINDRPYMCILLAFAKLRYASHGSKLKVAKSVSVASKLHAFRGIKELKCDLRVSLNLGSGIEKSTTAPSSRSTPSAADLIVAFAAGMDPNIPMVGVWLKPKFDMVQFEPLIFCNGCIHTCAHEDERSRANSKNRMTFCVCTKRKVVEYSANAFMLVLLGVWLTLGQQSASDPVQKPGTARCVGTHCTAEYYCEFKIIGNFKNCHEFALLFSQFSYFTHNQFLLMDVDYSPNLAVTKLEPNSGPVQGGTEVTITGSGFRNFGKLMKCKFGNIVVPARLRTTYGHVFNPYNGDTLVCEAPQIASATAVAVEVTLTGDTYTNEGIQFTYYGSLLQCILPCTRDHFLFLLLLVFRSPTH